MVLYYDIFRHPLRDVELERLTGGDVSGGLRTLVASGKIDHMDGYVVRPGRRDQIPARVERTAAAERRWPAARRAARLLASAPWVRGVMVTGGLSKQSASPDGDIDFLVLVEAGRVWSAKSLLQGVRRTLPPPIRECFCTNYLLDERHLLLDQRNMFTAMELATAVPLHNAALCGAFLDANAWASAFVPGIAFNRARALAAPTFPANPVARAVERLLGPRVEAASMTAWDRYWNTKYDWLPAEVRRQRFKRRPEISTNHLHDFQQYVLDEYRQRCDAAGVAVVDVGRMEKASCA